MGAAVGLFHEEEEEKRDEVAEGVEGVSSRLLDEVDDTVFHVAVELAAGVDGTLFHVGVLDGVVPELFAEVEGVTGAADGEFQVEVVAGTAG